MSGCCVQGFRARQTPPAFEGDAFLRDAGHSDLVRHARDARSEWAPVVSGIGIRSDRSGSDRCSSTNLATSECGTSYGGCSECEYADSPVRACPSSCTRSSNLDAITCRSAGQSSWRSIGRLTDHRHSTHAASSATSSPPSSSSSRGSRARPSASRRAPRRGRPRQRVAPAASCLRARRRPSSERRDRRRAPSR